MVPSNIRKDLCGWSNYSGKVTSQKDFNLAPYTLGEGCGANRNGDYRGSKSIVWLFLTIVKEQRVDGSYIVLKFSLG